MTGPNFILDCAEAACKRYVVEKGITMLGGKPNTFRTEDFMAAYDELTGHDGEMDVETAWEILYSEPGERPGFAPLKLDPDRLEQEWILLRETT
jgi:hypothetical protein